MPTDIIEETPVVDTLDELEAKQQEQEPESEEDENQEPEPEEEPKLESKEEPQQDDEDIISFGDEELTDDQEHAILPPWVKDLRDRQKHLKRENQELKQSLKQYEPKTPQLGPEPTIEDCDYDAELFSKRLKEWHQVKNQNDAEAQRIQALQDEQNSKWQNKLRSYQERKKTLRVRDYAEAEATVENMFDVTQQGIMIQGATNPAVLVYALGKNPKKAQELAAIKEPINFAIAIGGMEKELKVSKRKPKTAPERSVKGTGRISGSVDSELERLREDAARTGNMSKVLAYRRKKRRNA